MTTQLDGAIGFSPLALPAIILAMQFAVLSDIHANLEALEAVLADMQEHAPAVDNIFSLGDVVGYGPDPEACVARIRECGVLSVLGNHELGVMRAKHRKWFNPQSREALKRTCELVSESTVEWMRTLPLFRVQSDCYFIHGLPPDSALKYLYELAPEELPAVMASVEQSVVFVGHTHELALVRWDGGMRFSAECEGLEDNALHDCLGVQQLPLSEGDCALDPRNRYIVNIGAVGQPRDGDPRAKYGIYDTEAHRLTVRFVPYDIDKTIEKFKQSGMPMRYAERLRRTAPPQETP